MFEVQRGELGAEQATSIDEIQADDQYTAEALYHLRQFTNPEQESVYSCYLRTECRAALERLCEETDDEKLNTALTKICDELVRDTNTEVEQLRIDIDESTLPALHQEYLNAPSSRHRSEIDRIKTVTRHNKHRGTVQLFVPVEIKTELHYF